MSRAAKATLLASILVSSVTVWGVHYLQQQEHDVRSTPPRFVDTVPILLPQTMYQGVLRDDERRKRKMKEREENFLQSQKKRGIYESVQRVETIPESDTRGS